MIIKKCVSNLLSRQLLMSSGNKSAVAILLGGSTISGFRTPFESPLFVKSSTENNLLAAAARCYGTSPGQKAQSAKEAKAMNKLRQTQVNRLRAAMKTPDGQLELDLTRNTVLAKTVIQLTKEGLPKETIQRQLDPKRKLVELTVMADGPEGMCLMIDCESKHFLLAKQIIQGIAKRSSLKLTVTEGHDWHHYFTRKGFVSIPSVIDGKQLDEEAATDLAIEVSAEEVIIQEKELELICDPSDYKECLSSLAERQIEVISSRIGYEPLDKITLDENYSLFYEAFNKTIMGSVDVNFNFLQMTTNFDTDS